MLSQPSPSHSTAPALAETLLVFSATAQEQCARPAPVLPFLDKETRQHQIRVAEIAEALAVTQRLTPHERSVLHQAALWHDIGKSTVPSNILGKEGQLNNEEWTLMQGHPAASARIIRQGFRGANVREIALVAEQHHERYDGKGYPYGLSNGQISKISYILALSDEIDALINPRCYKNAFSLKATKGILMDNQGKKYPPRFVEAALAELSLDEIAARQKNQPTRAPQTTQCILLSPACV